MQSTDYDPEADVPDDSESDGESRDSEDEKAATEHYVNVGYATLKIGYKHSQITY